MPSEACRKCWSLCWKLTPNVWRVLWPCADIGRPFHYYVILLKKPHSFILVSFVELRWPSSVLLHQISISRSRIPSPTSSTFFTFYATIVELFKIRWGTSNAASVFFKFLLARKHALKATQFPKYKSAAQRTYLLFFFAISKSFNFLDLWSSSQYSVLSVSVLC